MQAVKKKPATKGGRPIGSGKLGERVGLHVWLSPDDLDKVRADAAKAGMTIQSYARKKLGLKIDTGYPRRED